MFIILNNKPLNLYKIDRVTEIIPLQNGRYNFSIDTVLDSTYDNYKNGNYCEGKESFHAITQKIIRYMEQIQPDEIQDSSGTLKRGEMLDDSLKDEKGNYGYYFVIWMEYSGKDKYICSKIYKTAAEAEEAQRHLLVTINEATYNLPHLEI